MAGEVIDIDEVKRNLAYRIQRFQSFSRPSSPDAWYCEELSKLSVYHRQHGICLLLSDSDWAGFRQDLVASATRRVELLQWLAESATHFEHISFVSNNGPFFDAVAAGKMDLAARIADLSNAPYSEDYEYPDDRAYTLFLYAFLPSGFGSVPEVESRLRSFLEATEGAGSSRYSICRAFADGDERAFNEALAQLIEEHGDAYEREAEGPIADHFRFRTEQYVFVEGMALRVIGQRLGFGVDEILRFLPHEGTQRSL